MSITAGPEELYGLLTRAGQTRSFGADDVIFEQGEPGDKMYVVSQGSVVLKDGDRTVDRVDAPGLFGELALIERDPRALTAVAETDADVVEITARQFWVLVHETPGFAHLVMSVMARRLRQAGSST
jgi:CRP/FNR family transcriptional regulator, cyclic AMP receptor protein